MIWFQHYIATDLLNAKHFGAPYKSWMSAYCSDEGCQMLVFSSLAYIFSFFDEWESNIS